MSHFLEEGLEIFRRGDCAPQWLLSELRLSWTVDHACFVHWACLVWKGTGHSPISQMGNDKLMVTPFPTDRKHPTWETWVELINQKLPTKNTLKEQVKQAPDNFNPGSLIPWYVDQDSSRLMTFGVPLPSIWITYALPTGSTIEHWCGVSHACFGHSLFLIYGCMNSSQNHSKNGS